MATAATVIKKALQLLSVIAKGDTPEPSQYADGLESLNDMINQWSIEGLLSVSETSVTHTLVVNDGAYTIGSGGDIDTTRPTEIVTAFVRDSGNIDYPIMIINEADYNIIPDKTVGGIPRRLYYDDDYPLGTINLYPLPNSAYTLHMITPAKFASFATVNTTVTLPDEYLAALKYNLAVMIAPEYAVNVPQEVYMKAEKFMKNIKRLHAKPPKILNSTPFTNREYGEWDYNTGWWV